MELRLQVLIPRKLLASFFSGHGVLSYSFQV